MANKKEKNNAIGRIGRVEREERLKRGVRIATATVLVIIVGILLFGFITEFFINPNQAIATVDGEVIFTKDYQARVKFERRQLVSTFSQWYNFYYESSTSGGDEFTLNYALDNLKRIESQLDVDTLGLSLLNLMIEDVIIEHEANSLGITVTDEEIEERIQSLFAYFPNGVPVPTTVPEIVPTSTLTAQQLLIATVVPTATVAATEVVEDVEPTPTEEVEDVVPLPTPEATEYTFEAYEETIEAFIDSVTEINFTMEDFSRYVSGIIYQEKLQEELTKDIPRTQEQVWARHILVETVDIANDLYDQIMDGEDFAELAAEFSIDSSNASRGGDLGWFAMETMVSEFALAAFVTPIGEISKPVETSFGFHLIQVVGHEERPLTPSEYTQLQATEFSKWLSQKVEDSDVVVEDYWLSRIPNEPAVPAQIVLPE
ncbi:MAG: hypothetical protein HON98_08020 [Chloroflexi bacterium]|jgi:peptidyl-prolyl cis-trans isomerase D|nr:hypothetical protein [Chloroflexota bacterium]MBT3669891.1 hypothetical protein [Chloroflexota bacterium]MBT4001964.1 hypothetical protein [Chloroflexota bacterium]MBT4304793.1 hypothetical protein [Chloroflexota bacterium]MBT4534706.1 hypothetical protein [Chloroflexota bacterium]